MSNKFLGVILALGSFVLLAGCSGHQAMAPQAFAPHSFQSGQYVSKVDNAVVILDSSMTMALEGENHFQNAKNLVSSMNQSIPSDVSFNGGLQTFGHSLKQSKNETDTVYGMTRYSRDGFQKGLDSVKTAGGNSPLSAALLAAGADLKGAKGKSAIVVVSDGLQMDSAPATAKQVVADLGGNVCIHTVFVGDKAAGKALLEKVAQASSCGSSVEGSSLASSANMGAFVENVFLSPKPVVAKAAPPKVDGDSDGDGVRDSRDKCPNTPRGEYVDEDGCTLKLTLHINFDFDKAEIKPEFKADLDKAAAFIQKHNQVPAILIAGHTDHTGTMEYNQQLSDARANAVREYLVANYGVNADRLVAKGYGKSQPVANNDSKEGRYQNRRVEIICCVLLPQ